MSRMKLRAAAAALGAVLLAACQGAGTTSSDASPAATPAPLAAADAKLYAGDYVGAETAYKDLVSHEAPGAAAHYAVLLDYESRFREAIANAQRDVARRGDSSNLARLTRAYDWAADIPGALDAGLRAVQARPVDPVAHAYYGEALADAGRYGEAEAQLRAAEATANDAYTRAEAYRDWGNYYRDRGDLQSELNNLQLSARAQPKFPERRLELARYYYTINRPDQARSRLQEVAVAAAAAPVLAAAGDAALMAGDLDTATNFYQSATSADAGLAEPVLALAVLNVASKHDFGAAHDAVLALLKRDPANGTAYQLLWNLDRYVLKADPGAELNAISGNGGADLAGARQAALAAVNGARHAAGVPDVAGDASLDTAAEEHAWYTVFNFGQKSLSGLGVHAEDPALPGYVAASSILRDRAAGYPGTHTAEVINHVFTPAAAVRVWLDSVYHRFPIVNAESTAAGYGEVAIGPLVVAVMDIGFGAAGSSGPVVFPADGTKDVPTAFIGNEVPDPAPRGTEYPVGYPITLEVGSAAGLAISAGNLTGPDGRDVPAWTLNPNKEVDSNEWSLLPQQPLKPGATYTVAVSGTLNGQPFSKRWSFTTVPAA